MAKAVFWIDGSHLYLRFEGLDRPTFQYILGNFKHTVTSVDCFDHEVKAWQLPVSRMQEVVVFVDRVFGPNTLEYRNNSKRGNRPKQLDLPLSWA